MKSTFKKIKKALLKHRAGLENTADHNLMTLWSYLDEDTKEKYLHGHGYGDDDSEPEPDPE